MPSATLPPEQAEGSDEPAGGKRRLAVVTVALVLIATSAIVGNLFWATLLTTHPLLLLALNATTRHLILTSTSIDVVPYVVVGLGRRLLEDPFLFLLGRWYGETAITWIDRRMGGGRWLEWVRTHFHIVGWLLVAFLPGGVVCVLAGASKMRALTFVVLNVGGTLVTIASLRRFGEEAREPIDVVLGVVAANVFAFTAGTIAMAGAYWLYRRRKAAKVKVEQ